MNATQQVYDGDAPSLAKAIVAPAVGISCPGQLVTGTYAQSGLSDMLNRIVITAVGSHENIAALASAELANQLAFGQLATQLEYETLVLSSPLQMLQHPSVAELKKMPHEALLQRIFSRLDAYPVVWMTVLSELTGENPAPERDWGRVRTMVQHWKTWARAHNFIN